MTLWKYNTHCITDNICPSSIFRVINLLSPRKLCQTLLLRYHKPSPEQLNPSTKNPGVLNCKCLGLYVTRQLIWRQTPKLCVTVYWNKIYSSCCKARQRLKETMLIKEHHRVYYKLTMACSQVGLISLMAHHSSSHCKGQGSIPGQAWVFFAFFFNHLGCSFNGKDHVHFHL